MAIPRILVNSRLRIGIQTIEKKIDKLSSNCWIWTGCVDNMGYGYSTIILDGKTISKKVHRIMYALEYKKFNLLELPPNQSGYLLHHCNNKRCCNPSHLSIATTKQITSHSIDDHLIKTGDDHAQHKLTNGDVIEIRSTNDSKLDQYFANKFYVSKSLISQVRRGNVRRHG